MIAVHGDKCRNGSGSAARSVLVVDSVETLYHKLRQGCFAYEGDEQRRRVGRKREQNEKMSERRVCAGGEDDKSKGGLADGFKMRT